MSYTDNVNERIKLSKRMPRQFTLEILALILAALSMLVIVWSLITPSVGVAGTVAAGIMFTVSVAFLIWLITNPESIRAHQTDSMLRLASKLLNLMDEGMTPAAAQGACKLLLPGTAAIAVAITDKEAILGYAGYQEAENPTGSPIRTQATHETIADGKMRILYTPEEIGFPAGPATIKAAIIVPLIVGRHVEGTLKFYYRDGKRITETQRSIAQGFGRLLSTEMAAVEVEEQRKQATSMELKMLQSQINPHFLFNTINTIASLIRTDPMKARTLLRDFAVFYRRTLEDSAERILLSREIEQTMRYFSFEVARFGEERLAMEVAASETLRSALVPPFLIQPMVENAVKHAMPSEGRLVVTVLADREGDDVIVRVLDNGVGMTEEACANIMHPTSETGLGIAVKNVHDRLKGFFGPDADMKVESVLGRGTLVTLRLAGCAASLPEEEVNVEFINPLYEEKAGERGKSATAPAEAEPAAEGAADVVEELESLLADADKSE